ncbi:MAG: hypothetical protein Ct9H300mP1_07910 [Planctomycetaceae bacterium]|nr:MAG: hypothetical protein Ct9H300mP1_07910 [Planctomycetaceae bacterium]
MTQASMPTASIHFTPSRLKNSGMTSMKKISEICPKDIVDAIGIPVISTTRLAIW